MLKVECEACKAPYQVDERRVPPTGLKMRCPKCGHAFTVKHPDMAASSSPASKHTIMGVSAAVAPAPAAAPPGARAVPTIDDADLPQRAAPKAPPPKPGAKVAPLPPAPALGEIDELLDLPAMPSPGLPAPVKPIPPVKPTLISQQVGPGKAPSAVPSLSDYDDLPSATADLPARPKPPAKPPAKPPPPKAPPPKPPVPAVGGALFDDLPLPAGPAAGLPAAKPGKPPPPFADLPAPRDNVGLPAARDNVGLPAARDNVGLPAPLDAFALPAVRDNVGLPAAFGGVGLPAPLDGGFGSIDFPSLGSVGLPTAAGALPATVDQNNYLPRAAAPGAHLPSAVGADMHLPSALDALPSTLDALPSALNDSQFLPSSANEGAGDALALGEADFEAAPRPPAAQAVPGGQGGVGFGELDFGAGGSDVSVEADVAPAPASMREPAGGEAALPTDERPKARERVVISKGQGKATKIAAAGILVVVLAGLGLGLTRHGFFGWSDINDSMNKGKWTAAANDSVAKARAIIQGDVFDKARNAADAIATDHGATPRSQGLTAAAALVEYEYQLRFGRDASRATRAAAWLKSIADVNSTPTTVPFYSAAVAARTAADGEIPAARTLLDAASQKDTGDPVQEDIACVRGEIELKAKDAAAAVKAFSRALQVAPSARAHFGLARAYALAGDPTKVLSEIKATLAATPNHPGALVLKAAQDWQMDRNDAAVIDGLKPLVDGPLKATASASELSRAYTFYGIAIFSRGDMGTARSSFDAALKLDSTNTQALLGQGEVFFADGRNTEALSRFDTAVQAEPDNPAAIIADAKAKLALERLAAAKSQLAAAQKAMPKDAQISFWLGKSEEALGNKKGAEEAYAGAIALTNPKDHDAILPYVALSTLLAGQGRATEAQAKLNEARAKLPDSAALQRALGEVAVAQGLFDDAVAHFQTALTKDPNDLKSRYLLGDTYLRMNRLDEAAAQFDKVAAADKDYPNLSLSRGRLLEKSGHVDQALDQFKAALAKAPNDPDLLLRVGAAYVGIGRGEDAYKILKPVYDQRQNSAEVNYYIGRACLLQGGSAHLVEAKRFLQKAVDVEPTNADFHLYVAEVGTESQDWKLAEDEVKKALELNQLLGDAYWQKAIVEEVKGEVDDAIRDAMKSLQLQPSRIEAHATLAKCYSDKNQREKAVAEWALATARAGEHPDWEYQYGRLLFEDGNVLGALPHVLAAAKAVEAGTIVPPPVWGPQVEFMTAKGQLKEKNKVDAKEHLHRFIDTAERSNPDLPEGRRLLHELEPDWRPN